jgi:glycosyltransferase involved in cell wall biosynthesis
LIEDSKTGWLVPAKQPVALARAILEALEDPRDFYGGQK